MAKGADLAQHVHKFNQIISDLLRIDIKFDDENKAMMLLSSLSASYKHLVTTLLWGKETLEFEEIPGALLDYYQRKQNLGESEGFMVKGNQDCGRKKDRDHNSARGHSRSKFKSKTVKCYKCQKKGHIKRDCPEWKRGKDKDKEGSPRSANIMAANSDSDSDGDMLSVSSSASRLIDS